MAHQAQKTTTIISTTITVTKATLVKWNTLPTLYNFLLLLFHETNKQTNGTNELTNKQKSHHHSSVWLLFTSIYGTVSSWVSVKSLIHELVPDCSTKIKRSNNKQKGKNGPASSNKMNNRSEVPHIHSDPTKKTKNQTTHLSYMHFNRCTHCKME